jgi:4-oxalocrotonate tautomerase
MPEILIHAVEGRTIDQKRGLVKDITEAVVKNFGVDAGSVVITLVEAQKHNKSKGGILFSDQ